MLKLAFFSDLHNNQYYLDIIMKNIETLSKEKGLDAMALVGDIIYLNTNVLPEPKSYERLNANEFYTKMKNEGKLLFAMGNHEFTLWMEGEEIKTLSRNTFIEQTGLTPEKDTVINGYHFITAGPADYAGTPSKEIEDFVKAKADAALKESDNKPVFILLHFPIDDTLYGTIGTNHYNPEFREYIKSEPRFVVISGHHHFPNSDPRTIMQVEKGGTFIFTSTIMGGNGLSLPTATERHSEYPSQGFMLLVDEETNVVTVKPFYTGEKEPSYLENADCSVDIPAMMRGEKSAYKYTDERIEKSAKPYFEKAEIKLENTSDIDATITFPAALQGDAGQDSVIAYYEIDVYHKGEIIKKNRIISDFFLKNKRESYTYTVFDLAPDSEYTVKVYPITAWYKEGDSIELSFKTKEPKFMDVALDDVKIVKGVFDSVITGSRTAYSNLIHIGSGWECLLEHTVDIEEAGVYRAFVKASAKGALDAFFKVKKDGKLLFEDTVVINTGNIHVYKDIICADFEFKEKGSYGIDLYFKDGANTVGIQDLILIKHK